MDRSIRELVRAVAGSVELDAGRRARAARDGSHLKGTPTAVVVPRDARDVAAVIAWARSYRTPIVARGGGTSLDGESVPLHGGVVIDLSGWDRVLEVDPREGWARVEPGVVNRRLQRILARHRLFFPPNPGSWERSTIGGNVATNASGPRSFRYGATRAWIREIELVLGTGERARWGTRVRKRSVGPDLVSMFVGSEGTLGVATEVVVRVAPIPAVRRGVVVAVPNRASLGRIAQRLATTPGTGLSAVEYLDAACASELQGLGADEERGRLLLEIEADDHSDLRRKCRRTLGALRDAGLVGRPTYFEDADELWSVRGHASLALDRRVGQRIREDVAVPLGAIDQLRAEILRIAARDHISIYLFGHLGEGNLHPNFVVPPEGAAARRARQALLASALRLGGTISGEHGIGALKTGFVEREIGRPGIDVLRALKQACDPDGILNPGKLLPERSSRRSSRSPSVAADARARRDSPSVAPRRVAPGRRARALPRRRAARP